MTISRLILALVFLIHAAQAGRAGPADACAYSAEMQGVSCLIMIDGQTVHEAYSGRGAPDRAFGLASGTKSFSGLVAAAAVQDGLLRLDEKVSDTVTEWQNDERAAITVRQLLSLTSGLDQPAPMERLSLSYREAIGLPAKNPPGTSFFYSQAPFQIFAGLMERKLQGRTFGDYLSQRVLNPIGAPLDRVRTPWGGDPNWGGGASMTARNWARFGEFVRLGGKWRGRMLVDAQALADNFKGSAANPGYGLTWWLNVPKGTPLPDSPTMRNATDFYSNAERPLLEIWMAAGAGKQRLYIIPARRIVAVRQSAWMIMGERVPYSDVEFLNRLLGP